MIEAEIRPGVSAKLDAMPTQIERLAFVSAFVDAHEMRRLFSGHSARRVAEALGLDVLKEPEAETCRRIEAHWKGLA